MSLDVLLYTPEPCPHCKNPIRSSCEYSANITHNLATMADKAGIYKALWRPEEIGVTTAIQLIPLLQTGLAKLLAKPKYYRKFNPENGWGSYGGLCEFVRDYLEACEKNPSALVNVSR